ncbi:hypothetical protein CFAM422_003510 [Trichoderma lentiforme]|uniref:Uncharacterized protein n=1 Tax=Trichoderma lentiforme TaxID=1567552 RepID=A0A9P5CE99_9HYPO|nr:hypothetical protein CFAM422_003510 [Trichoderma lentiforme]
MDIIYTILITARIFYLCSLEILSAASHNLAKQLLSLHAKGAEHVDATSHADQNECLLHGLCDGQNGLVPELSGNLLKDGALGSGNGVLDVGGGEVCVCQDRGQVLGGLGLEDLASNDEAKDGASDLRDVLHGESATLLCGLDFEGGHGISDLEGQASSHGCEDCEAVDVAGRGRGVEVGGEEGAAEGDEEAGDEEDGHVVSDSGQEVAGGHVEADSQDDERQQADGGGDGRVAVDELEVDGDEVDDDEERGDVGGGGDEEQDLGARSQQVDGERAVLGRREDGKRLLDGVRDDDDAESNNHADGTAVVPGPLAASHGEGHAEGDPCAGPQKQSEETTHEDAATSRTSNDSTDDESRHSRRSTTNGRTDAEENHGGGKNARHRTEGKPSADPGELLDVPESLDDRALDVGGDGGVEAVDEGGDVEGDADEDPAEAGYLSAFLFVGRGARG